MAINISVRQGAKTANISVRRGANLLTVLLDNNFEIASDCGGKGSCGKCRVKVLKPAIGEVLACTTAITEAMELLISESGKMSILHSSITQTELKEGIFKEKIYQPQKEPTSFSEDLIKQTGAKEIAPFFLKELNQIQQGQKYYAIVMDQKVIALSSNKFPAFYGAAIDLGTTSIVISLLDLANNNEVDIVSFYNPQRRFGSDVISRIDYAQFDVAKVEELQKVLSNELRNKLSLLLTRNKLSCEQLLRVTVAGNTIMQQSLLGLNCDTIAKAPYTPRVMQALTLAPSFFDFPMNKRGIVDIMPAISGYIGGDLIGGMLVCNLDLWPDQTTLLIDLGTNGEIILQHQGQLYACSAAAGPAFEGARIKCGMAGFSGAIDSVTIDERGQIKYTTIDNIKPKGICGSGLLDLVASLRQAGLIDHSGRLSKLQSSSPLNERIFSDDGQEAFLVAEDTEKDSKIYLTQKDIRELQLAKGAIAAGIEILLTEASLKSSKLDRVFLAGGFGNYLNPQSAQVIKLLPADIIHRVQQAGNTSLAGAKLYLNSKLNQERGQKLAKAVKYVELARKSEFQLAFMAAMEM